MGVINATPDSFSGDGVFATGTPIECAIQQAQDYIQAGADIIDIGGKSTKPGAKNITTEEELSRVIPIVETIHSAFPDIILSIDTTDAVVVEYALKHGASIINDVSGMMSDPDMYRVAAQYQPYVVIMHSHQNPCIEQTELGTRYLGNSSFDITNTVYDELESMVVHAISQGVDRKKIIIDPGIGFGKTVEQNLQLLSKQEVLKNMGFPLLIGTSRKSFIGYTLGATVDNRLGGSIASAVFSVMKGANILRVHDVAETVQAVRIIEAILDTKIMSAA
jgi:dihydropteroate synthase